MIYCQIILTNKFTIYIISMLINAVKENNNYLQQKNIFFNFRILREMQFTFFHHEVKI